MKTFNVLFVILVLACLGLSFMSPNNLDKAAVPTTETAAVAPEMLAEPNSDTISAKQLQDFVNKELIAPLRACMEEADPHVFMTKCYSKLKFVQTLGQFGSRRLYKDSYIRGRLVFIDCSEENFMADVRIHYKSKEIMIKESFRTPNQSHKEYLKSICKHLEKTWKQR